MNSTLIENRTSNFACPRRRKFQNTKLTRIGKQVPA